jgi:hypothetical protein
MSQTYAALPEREDVDAKVFREEIVPAGRPVVLRGLVADWELTKAASDPDKLTRFLVAEAAPGPVGVFFGKPEIGGRYYYDDAMRGFNFERRDMVFPAFMQALKEADDNSLYMGSQPMPNVMPGLAKRCGLPHVPNGTPPRIWIGNDSNVSPHYDMDRNIACVVAGQRRFTLFPPDQIANLYPGPIEHNIAGPQVALIDPERPDLERYPRFADAIPHGQSADLGPGDALYIPPLWWHQVRATGPLNVLVNFWWPDTPDYSRPPMSAFVLALLTIRQQPEAEREAWRALFNYFVFQDNGPPMEHLPDEVRGVLGPISPQRAQQIWGYFVSLMK